MNKRKAAASWPWKRSCYDEEVVKQIWMDSDALSVDCSVCFMPFEAEVFMCQNGHAACGECCGRINGKCWCCGDPIGGIRCRLLESVLSEMNTSCRFSEHGCKENLKYVDKRRHEETCPHAPRDCPVCDYRGGRGDLYAHLLGDHTDAVVAASVAYLQTATVDVHKDDPFVVVLLMEPDAAAGEGSVFLLLNSGGGGMAGGRSLSLVCLAGGEEISYKMEVRGGAVQVGNGQRTLFWEDNWVDGRSVQHIAPHLFAMIPARIARRLTVAQAIPGKRWVTDVRGGLSVLAISEYIDLWYRLENVQLRPNEEEAYRWRWTSDGRYTAKSAYLRMQEGSTKLQGATRIWKSWAPPRVKFFAWLATKKKIWTADRRRRHGLDAHDDCWLCEQERETTDHILVGCPYAKEIWWTALTSLNCVCDFPAQEMELQDWWTAARQQQPKTKRRGFDTLALLLIWNLWKERNRRLFDNRVQSAPELLNAIRQEALMWIEAGAKRLGELCSE